MVVYICWGYASGASNSILMLNNSLRHDALWGGQDASSGW